MFYQGLQIRKWKIVFCEPLNCCEYTWTPSVTDLHIPPQEVSRFLAMRARCPCQALWPKKDNSVILPNAIKHAYSQSTIFSLEIWVMAPQSTERKTQIMAQIKIKQ